MKLGNRITHTIYNYNTHPIWKIMFNTIFTRICEPANDMAIKVYTNLRIRLRIYLSRDSSGV